MLFIFRSLYLCAIGLWPVFSFRRHLPPALSSIPKLLDSSKEPHTGWASDRTGLSPSAAPRSRGLGRRPRPRRPLQITTRAPRGVGGPDFKFELLPLHSPLLGQSLLVSFPPLIDMLKFSGYSYLIRGQPSGSSLGGGRAARPGASGTTTLGAAAAPPLPFGACGAGRRAPAQAGLGGWR